MTYSPLLILHIGAAIIGLLAGALALSFRKGSRLHGAAGNVFTVALLSMSASGAILALLAYWALRTHQLLNVIAGVLTFYWTATGWLALQRRGRLISTLEYAAMLCAMAIGAAGLMFGFDAANSPTGLRNGDPAGAYFTFAALALFCGALDVSVLVRAGVAGAQRIARHLGRMCSALLITTLSFFLGKQRLFPEVVIRTHLNLVPVAVVALLLLFWLIRVLFTGAYKKKRVMPSVATKAGRREWTLSPR